MASRCSTWQRGWSRTDFQPGFHLLPVWEYLAQQTEEGAIMLGMLEVADLVGDHVVDAQRRCLYQLRIQQDSPVPMRAAPPLGHPEQPDRGRRELSGLTPGLPLLQSGGELGQGPLAEPAVEQCLHLRRPLGGGRRCACRPPSGGRRASAPRSPSADTDGRDRCGSHQTHSATGFGRAACPGIGSAGERSISGGSSPWIGSTAWSHSSEPSTPTGRQGAR
jgi:hypothetical protein